MANCLYLHDSYINKFDFTNYTIAELVVTYHKHMTLHMPLHIWNKVKIRTKTTDNVNYFGLATNFHPLLLTVEHLNLRVVSSFN